MLTPELLADLTPLLIALAIGCAGVGLTIWLSGARLDFSRLRRLHRCDDGGVQSLAFVLTFPVFLMVVMFIAQVSQLMLGVVMVHASAFASARAASVWVNEDYSLIDYQLAANKLRPPIADGVPIVLTANGAQLADNPKLAPVFRAAVLQLAPISPSRDLGYELDAEGFNTAETAYRLHTAVSPGAATNDRLPQRIQNKIAFARNQTAIRVEFSDIDTIEGPTYNPRREVELDDGSTALIWDPHEVGWKDPIRITVTHHYALLPGPGRLLARQLVRADGRPDRVSPRVDRDSAPGGVVYTVPITATCVLTNEGLRSTVPILREALP